MQKLLILFYLLFISTPILAQDAAETHPIDKKYDACLNKNGSTAGMVQCADEAYKAWDAELNKNFKLLMAKLNKTEQTQFKTAQVAWLAFRDKEFALSDALYGSLQGTMYIPMSVDNKLKIVRARALEMAGYLEVLEMGR
jgi:uncharacterized protein YecT (DUF1311 family)